MPAVVHDAVVRFNERFQDRQRQLGYLNANKQLHDLLHDLQDFQPQLESTIAAIRRPSADPPDPDAVTDPLKIWIEDGEKSVNGTEFPNVPKRWLGRFAKAVGDIKAEILKPDPATIDGAKLDRAVEILAHLPAAEQPAQNARLVECAMRLGTDDLVDLMDRVLIEMSKSGLAGAKTDQLREEVGAFRVLCRGLADLIADHNRCQDVDGALSEADGLPEVTPGLLSQWAEIKAWLQEIAGRRPGDLRANRPPESARQFEEATAAGDKPRAAKSFERLRERFRDLFFNTDKALLKMTQDLLASARTLDAILRRFP